MRNILKIYKLTPQEYVSPEILHDCNGVPTANCSA